MHLICYNAAQGEEMARPTGFEPVTSAFGEQCTTATSPKNPLNNRLRLHANGPEWTGEDWNGPSFSTFSAQFKSDQFAPHSACN